MAPVTSRDVPFPIIQIRLALPEDAATIAAVLYQSFIEYESLYTREAFDATTLDAPRILARTQEGPVWIAFRGSEALATVATVVKNSSLLIRGMAVLPAARRLHVATQLLDHIERQAIKEGCSRLVLSTTPFLHSAIRLYEEFGFRRKDDGMHDLFGTPIFMMEKKIPSKA